MNFTADLPPLPPRPDDAHKGSMGRVVTAGGSRGMAGAMVLCTEAALRSGCGYAVACVPGGIAAEMTSGVPTAVLRLCGDAARTSLSAGDLDEWRRAAEAADALAVGPGLGVSDGTAAFVAGVLRFVVDRGTPTVVDADALNVLAERRAQCEWPQRLAPNVVLTPHPGEAARLLGVASARGVEADRQAAVRALVEKTGAVVALKGAKTLVFGPETAIWANFSGNPGMATAGSGDVLTGVIAALAARGLAPYEAARLGVHLHGCAGDLAAAELGEESMIASDMLRYLPAAVRQHPRSRS